jgi:hypothetical protein
MSTAELHWVVVAVDDICCDADVCAVEATDAANLIPFDSHYIRAAAGKKLVDLLVVS